MNAVSDPVQVFSTPSASAPSATQPEFAATAVQLEAAPTLAAAACDSHVISIRADTVNLLEVISSFALGDLVRSVAFTPDGQALAAAGGNTGEYGIYIWDVASGQPIAILGGHHAIVWDIAFSPDGKLLASVSGDGTAQVHDWRAGDIEKVLNFPGQVVSVGFSPDGQTLVWVELRPQNQIQNAAVWMYAVGSWSPLLKLSEI